MTERGKQTWSDVWSSRSVRPTTGTSIADLLAADGYDTPFSTIEPRAWVDYVHRWAARLSIGPDSSVYEVGCGAGAFLLPLREIGATVGGCDLSSSLVDLARRAISGADITVADARSIADRPLYDVVVANTVFPYFPDLEYARNVVERMVLKSRNVVAVIDVPDSERHEEELARRAQLYGDPDAYRDRYSGLQHLAFNRHWFEEAFEQLGVTDLWFGHIPLEGYANGTTRFSVVATRSERVDSPLPGPTSTD